METAFPHLLAPGRIGSLEIRNRIVLTPMGTNLEAEDGTPGSRIERFYLERARGGAGLIVVGVTGVAWPAGVSNPRNMGLSRDEFIAPFARLVKGVHAEGARIAVQLQHAGRVALQDVRAGRPVWVPSILPDSAGDLFDALTQDEIARVTEPYRQPTTTLEQHEMTSENVARLCSWFASAAARSVRAGFDGIEIHAGHGYLLSAFLSPSTNLRSDAYGGPLENRARLLLEVIAAVRDRIGPEVPLWCRLDGVEYGKAQGISVDDAQRTAEWAVAGGLDAVHVSAYADPRSGAAFTDAPLPHEPGRYADLAAGIRRRVAVPVIAVGRLDPEPAEALLAAGDADFVAMGRRLLADPNLPRRLAGELPGTARPCVYAYRCVGNVFLGLAARCAVNPEMGREAGGALTPAAAPRHVLVVGGGPAGLETARRLALRGHRVTLCEARAVLGGRARSAAVAEPANAPLLAHLEAEVRRLGIEVRTDTPVSVATPAEIGADVAVLAVGARAAPPVVSGALPLLPADVLCHGRDAVLAHGRRIAVLGGDLIGLEVAERLGAWGAQVSLLEPGPHLGRAMAPPRRWRALHSLRQQGVSLRTGTRLAGTGTQTLRVEGPEGEATLACDALLWTDGFGPAPALSAALAERGVEVHDVGDCLGLRYFEGAFEDAARVASLI